jgi:hypothetical protein
VNVQLLIDSVVQQVTVLIAQLATSGGARAPVAHIASQVFVDLAHELQAQGLSRKVSADMFGMALRAYQRKLARLTTEVPGRADTLWRGLLDLIDAEGPLTRSEVLERYASDDETLIRGVLHDLCDSGLLACSGKGADAEYRARSERKSRARTNAAWTSCCGRSYIAADQSTQRRSPSACTWNRMRCACGSTRSSRAAGSSSITAATKRTSW